MEQAIRLFHNIERLSYEKGMTVSSVCKRAGVSPSVIYDLKYERKETLTDKTIRKLCSVLECSPNDMFLPIEQDIPRPPVNRIDPFIERATEQLRERKDLRRLVSIAMRSSDKQIRAVAMLLEEGEK